MKFQELGARLQSCWAVVLFVLVFSPVSNSSAQTSQTYRIVHTYPHDQQAFTQGLFYVDGHLYESTGKEGRSSLREEDLETGRILRMQLVSDKYFAEGLTDWKNTLVQLTWQSHIASRLRSRHLPPVAHLLVHRRRLGPTHDAHSLILSDGTATLRFFDPETFHEIRRITVKDNGKPVKELNELEYIHGEIYANIWHADRIARISPATGRVVGWIDLKGLMPRSQLTDDEAVLNGIAYDVATRPPLRHRKALAEDLRDHPGS